MRSIQLRDYALHLVHAWRFRRYLRQAEVAAGVRPHRMAAWHSGMRYFRGRDLHGDGDLFIKNGTRSMIHNEVQGWQRVAATDGGKAFLVQLEAHSTQAEFPFAAFRHMPGERLADVLDGGATMILDEVGKCLVAIVDVLHAAELVHRDLTPSNLLVRPHSDTLPPFVLIDYAFAVASGDDSGDAEVPEAVLRTLGDGFNPAPLVWDDAYSALQILRLIECVVGRRMDQHSRALEMRVGRAVHRSLSLTV